MNVDDFASYTVADMRGICRNKGFKGYSRLNRAELIAFLIDALATPDVEVGDVVVWHMTDGTPVYGVVKTVADGQISVRMPVWRSTYSLLFTEYVKVTGAKATETVEWLILEDWDSAENEDALLTEVYGHRAEDAGMEFAPFLAHVREHRNNGQIIIGGLWDCCPGNEVAVIVFDDGTKHAVCQSCANSFSGTIEAIPTGEHRECMTCGVVHIHPGTESAGIGDPTIDAFLTMVESAIEPLSAHASEVEAIQWEHGSDEAEQWTTVAKDLRTALANVEWMIRYRAS